MSSLDLVQLRWQHIRTLEAYQLLQRENQSLREENEKLKARPPTIITTKYTTILSLVHLTLFHSYMKRDFYMHVKALTQLHSYTIFYIV